MGDANETLEEAPNIVYDYLSTIDINELATNPNLRKLYNKSIESQDQR
jgi:hypothetical protein